MDLNLILIYLGGQLLPRSFDRFRLGLHLEGDLRLNLSLGQVGDLVALPPAALSGVHGSSGGVVGSWALLGF